MKIKLLLVCFSCFFLFPGCFLLGQAPKKNPEQKLFEEIMTAFNNRAFESSIKACEQFLSLYPKSQAKDPVLMRMGESFEGLLKQNYQDLLNKVMDEGKARASFLATYGSYNCWEDRGGELVYNKEIFRKLLKEHPESFYADEAFYNLIPWERNYDEDPTRVEKEIKGLNEVLSLYPTTSLRPKILFQMGYRFHILYEIYRFSKDLKIRDEAKAKESFHQAEYLYQSCLNFPQGSEYSKKALNNLDMLKEGIRIYLK